MTQKLNLWKGSENASAKSEGKTGIWKREEKPFEAGEWERAPTPDDGSHLDGLPEVPEDRRRISKHWAGLHPDQKRRTCLTFSVTQQESDMLRAHAETLDISFSQWVRNTLFRAMGRKPPTRRVRSSD